MSVIKISITASLLIIALWSVAFSQQENPKANTENALNNSIRNNPNNPEAYYQLGLFYAMNGKHSQAIIEFNKALEIKPDNAEVYMALGMSQQAVSLYKSANESFKRAAEINPEYLSDAFNHIGSVYREVGGVDSLSKALNSYLKALEGCKNKKNIICLSIIQNIVTCYLDLASQNGEHIADSKEYLKKAIYYAKLVLPSDFKNKYPQQYGMIQYSLGEAYVQLLGAENLKNAKEAYLEALSIFNNQQYPNEHKMIQNSLEILDQEERSLMSKQSDQKERQKGDIVIQILRENGTPLPDALVSLYEKKDDEFVKAHFRDIPVDHLAQFTVPSSVFNTLPKGSEIFIHTPDGFYWQSVKTENLQIKRKSAKILVSKTGIISGTILKFPDEIGDPVLIEADKRGDNGKYTVVTGIGTELSIGYTFNINGLSSGVYKIQVKKSYDSSKAYFVKEGIKVVSGKKTDVGNMELK
jgi:tetratricopeptide (TPR) repeat protein